MKKRIVFVAAGVLALSVGVYVSTRLMAQPAAQPQPQHVQTRIGILNMGYVLKNYQKVDAYTVEMKENFKKFDDALKAKKGEIEVRTKQAADPKYTQAERDACAKEITNLNRQAEDMQNDMKKYIGTKTDEQMVTIYKEIQEAATRYAMSQGLDCVLTYIDAVKEADFLNPMNVMGKMQQRACMPLYYNKGMDVSVDITNALNTNYQASKGVTPTSGSTPPAH